MATLLLTVHLAGCLHWQPTQVPPVLLIEDVRPRQVRVTTLDGERRVVRSPEIRADSVISGAFTFMRPAGIPISQIGSLEVQRVSTARTVLLVGVGAVVSTFMILAANLCEGC